MDDRLQVTPVDPIEKRHFRASPEGGEVFFPWALSGRGYAVVDEARKRAILRGLRFVYGAAIASSSIAFGFAQSGLDPADASFTEFVWIVGVSIAPALVCFAMYGLWVWRLVEGLPPSDLRFTPAELRAEAAEAAEPGELRKLILACVGLLFLAGLAAWARPDQWWVAAVAAGLVAFLVALAVLQLRARRSAPGSGGSR